MMSTGLPAGLDTEWADSDGDGIGDNADTDDNNNGIPDDCDADCPAGHCGY